MAELRECPRCSVLFNYTGLRDVCEKCYGNEEKLYEEVLRFLRRRENRAATIGRIVEMTGVTEILLHQWVRKGRLQPALFPNLGYPCDNCGKLTTTGILCDSCKEDFKNGLRTFEAARQFREAIVENEKATYNSGRKLK